MNGDHRRACGAIRSVCAGVVTASIVLSLAGCAEGDPAPVESACRQFETGWNALAAARDTAEGIDDVVPVHASTVELWQQLAIGEGPDDLTEMIGRASDHLVDAWNATSAHGRASDERSLRNAGEYVAGRCADFGVDVAMRELRSPIRPGAA